MRGMAREYAQGTLSDRAGASLRGSSVVRWVGRSPTVPSGREWNGSQPGQGAAELLSPRPAIAGSTGVPKPSGQGEEPPPEGLGGGYPLSQTDIVWTSEAARGEMRFLDDPLIEPTNNRAERALRPAVIARKVSQCSKNLQGAYGVTDIFGLHQRAQDAGPQRRPVDGRGAVSGLSGPSCPRCSSLAPHKIDAANQLRRIY